MNSTIKDLLERRSYRSFKPEQITDEELKTVLEAGIYAPTASNRQLPQIIAIQNREDIALLSRLNAAVMGRDNDPFYGAPTVVVVFGKPGEQNFHTIKDASLIMGNMLNAAHAIGLGGCWIDRAKEEFETPEGKELLKKYGFDPDEWVGVGNCILGYPEGEPRPAAPRREGYYKIIK